ncbi:MAG: S8 family serine peptidase [Actinomycetes bacterium]
MRRRSIVWVAALGIVFALCSLTAGASGARPWGKLDQAVVAAAERDQRCALSAGEVAVLRGADGAAPSRMAGRKGIAGRAVAGDERFVIVAVGRNAAGVDLTDPSLAPVFRAGNGPDAPFLFPTGEVMVKFKLPATGKQAAAWVDAHGLTLVRPLALANTFLLKASSPSQSLAAAAAAAAADEVVFCVPNWLRQRSERRQDDPLYPYQWHLDNTGEVAGTVAGNDINVESVWAACKGSPEQVICIVDDGLEIAHKDLAANVVAGLSWDFIRKQADPTAGDHGTECGGVAAARGFNDVGVRGVAPEAGLSGHRIHGAGATDADEAEAEVRNCERISVYNNSWGPKDDGKRLEGPKEPTREAMTYGITHGRGGKGAIYTWAAGNGLMAGDDSNYDGYANWRYTIAVAASDSAGKQSDYSERGANLCVNAPSSGGADTGITTVDRSGPLGANKTGWEQGDFADLDFTNGFGGTSSACPTVSGACALMLQANPDLGWRDVKKILMTTAVKNDPSDGDWTTNAAGYHVNHKYGFGRVDVAAAVAAAGAWTNLTAEVSARGIASPRQAIPRGSRGVASTITLPESILIESVEVYFTADHHDWGDLSVVLTAPSGTSSVLAGKHDTSGTKSSYADWRFGSERHLGEMSAGDWTLTVRDLGARGGGTFTKWGLVVYGTDPGADAVSLTTVASPAGWGSVSPTGSTRVDQGLAAGIGAAAAAGYHFTEWTADPEQNVAFGFGGRQSPRTTVTLSGDATLSAVFSASPPETASVAFAVFPRSGGLADPGDRVAVNVGAGLAIMAMPSATFSFVKWTADPAAHAQLAGAASVSTIALIGGDVTLTAVFRAPDIDLTQGSVAQVPAAYLEIPAFTKAPKVTGSMVGGPYAMNVVGGFPAETVAAEWQAQPKIYDPADYRDPVNGLGVLLEEEPMAAVGLQALVVDATKADGAKLDLVDVAACAVVPPVLFSVTGDRTQGSSLVLMGSHFGTKPPRVSIEYKKHGAYFARACKLVDDLPYTDAHGKPSCMDPLPGDSQMSVLYPALPRGAEPTGYLILANPIGKCSLYLLPRAPRR